MRRLTISQGPDFFPLEIPVKDDETPEQVLAREAAQVLFDSETGGGARPTLMDAHLRDNDGRIIQRWNAEQVRVIAESSPYFGGLYGPTTINTDGLKYGWSN